MSFCPVTNNVKFGNLVKWFPPDFCIVKEHFPPLKVNQYSAAWILEIM